MNIIIPIIGWSLNKRIVLVKAFFYGKFKKKTHYLEWDYLKKIKKIKLGEKKKGQKPRTKPLEI